MKQTNFFAKILRHPKKYNPNLIGFFKEVFVNNFHKFLCQKKLNLKFIFYDFY